MFAFQFALLAFLFIQAQPGATALGAGLRGLSDLPNTSIDYYEVAGNDLKSINAALKERKSAAGRPATDWKLGVSLDKTSTDGKCTIAKSTVKFSATAVLPRLSNEHGVSPALLASWRSHVAQLAADSAAKLWFVYDRVPAIEKAFAGKSCEQGTTDGRAAMAQLQKDVAAFEAQLPAKGAALDVSRSPESSKFVCRVMVLGSDNKEDRRSKPAAPGSDSLDSFVVCS
jgi:predicted secreted Zn-dependent protease